MCCARACDQNKTHTSRCDTVSSSWFGAKLKIIELHVRSTPAVKMVTYSNVPRPFYLEILFIFCKIGKKLIILTNLQIQTLTSPYLKY